MRIGYFADGPWSHLALEKIAADDRFEIQFIVPRYDNQDPVLRSWAKKLNIDFLPIKNVNLPECIDKLRSYNADLFVSLSFNQILNKEIINAAPCGFINCHAGALPYYRGRNILNWALINDEKEFGVTVHYIDEGIDTGDIIKQRLSSITEDDDYKSLLDKAISVCAEVLYEALVDFVEDKVIRKPQSDMHPSGFYCSRRIEGDEWLDWNWPSKRIFNFVRAISEPGPCAQTIINGRIIKIKKARLVADAIEYIGTPGEVVGITDDGMLVKTGDSVILIVDVAPASLKKYIGLRFGVNQTAAINELAKRIEKLELALDKTRY